VNSSIFLISKPSAAGEASDRLSPCSTTPCPLRSHDDGADAIADADADADGDGCDWATADWNSGIEDRKMYC
jgi:hypothetical protein